MIHDGQTVWVCTLDYIGILAAFYGTVSRRRIGAGVGYHVSEIRMRVGNTTISHHAPRLLCSE
jgi:hypothetical protein